MSCATRIVMGGRNWLRGGRSGFRRGFRTGGRSIAVVIGLVIGLACLVGIAERAPARSTPSKLTEIRVMSFNLRYGTAQDGENSWEHRSDLVRGTIAAYAPHLLGTQECLGFQAEFLQRNLPDHEFVGVGRDDGAENGEMCGIFYDRRVFEKIEEGHFWLSETPDVVASKSWDAALTRMASWVRLRLVSDSLRTICFFNTHFDHAGATARTESARVLRQKIEEISAGDPVILTGDFNAAADHEIEGPYRALLFEPDAREPKWIDTYRHLYRKDNAEGTFNAFRGESDGARIDWIIVSREFSVTEAAIVRLNRKGRYPSDHYPVTARVQLRGRDVE